MKGRRFAGVDGSYARLQAAASVRLYAAEEGTDERKATKTRPREGIHTCLVSG